jgi:hypothetical protein
MISHEEAVEPEFDCAIFLSTGLPSVRSRGKPGNHCPGPSPLRRANIASEFLRVGLDLFETLLHDIADADDSMKSAILNDWQMPDTLPRHHLHESTSWSSDEQVFTSRVIN